MLCYPTAIGSEPDHPDFDTQPLWQQVIVGNGIANGLFMVVPNRFGTEGLITFYGSSFIADPYGRILVQAPRHLGDVIDSLGFGEPAEALDPRPHVLAIVA